MYSGEEYYYKADNLIRISCQTVQGVFRDRWNCLTGSEWTEESANEFIKGKGKPLYSRSKSIQKRLLEEGNVEEWDLTLLSGIFNLKSFDKPDDDGTWKQKKCALQEICSLRNKLAHNAMKKISPETYQEMETTIRKCLLMFGVSASKIEELISHVGVTSSVAALDKANQIQESGDEEYSKGNYSKAITYYDKALLVPSLLPGDLCTLCEKRASCYFEIGKRKTKENFKKSNLTQAMNDIEQALDYNDASWKAYAILARIHKEKHDIKTAIHNFTRALAISPGQTNVKAELEECKLLDGQIHREEHLDPQKMPNTLEEITEHYKKASGLNFTPAQFLQGGKHAERLLAGSADVREGHRYANGWRVRQNYTKAAHHFSKAMEKGNAEGIYNLAVLYFDGKGVKRNIPYAIELLKIAVNKPEKIKFMGSMKMDIGVRAAQMLLGLRYAEGIGVPQDYRQAADLYARAASNGCGNAANNLGNLYLNGRGVNKDLTMAEMYWKRAAEAGNCNAAFNLSTYFVDEMEPYRAKFWLDKWLKLNHNSGSEMDIFGLLSMIEGVKETRNRLEDVVLQFEKEQNLSVGKLTFRQRKHRMDKTGMRILTKVLKQNNNPDAAKTESTNVASSYSDTSKSATFSFFPNEIAHESSIAQAAMIQDKFSDKRFQAIIARVTMGSITAQRVLGVIGIKNFIFSSLHEGLSFSNETTIDIISNAYQIDCMEPHLFRFETEEMRNRFQTFLISLFETHSSQRGDMDRMIRACYALHVTDKEEDIRKEALIEGIRRYPHEVVYYKILSSIYGSRGQHELGLEQANKGLNFFPKDVDLLYHKAVHTRLLKDVKSTRKAYIEFIGVAPQDHRFTPEAYYCLAVTYANEDFEKVVKFYMSAQAVEKCQLPCYLPYESLSKMRAKALVDAITSRDNNFNIVNQEENIPSVPANTSKYYLKDPKRVEIIKEHRLREHEIFKFTKNQIVWCKNLVPTNTPVLLEHKLPKNLASLKEITLQDMDACQDKIYKRQVLNLTLIENPTLDAYSSIHTVAMDDNKDAIRLFVYNVPHTEEMREKLAFGSKLAILNPYMRMCKDWKNGIRVDEPKCIFYLEKVENMCRYCGQENAPSSCSKCKWARYCGRECQKADWKLLDHKLICNPS